MNLFNRKIIVENIRELTLEDLSLVSGGGNTSETFPSSGDVSHTNGGGRGGSTSNNGTQYSECGTGGTGGRVICVPNRE